MLRIALCVVAATALQLPVTMPPLPKWSTQLNVDSLPRPPQIQLPSLPVEAPPLPAVELPTLPQAPDGFGLGLGLPPETAGLGGLGGGLGGLGGGASDLEWPGLPSWLTPPAATAMARCSGRLRRLYQRPRWRGWGDPGSDALDPNPAVWISNKSCTVQSV